jgi:uncharacterized cupin superfamily protein
MELIIHAPKNFHVPRHWHSANETLTIISGTFTMKHDGSDEKVALETSCPFPALGNPGREVRPGLRPGPAKGGARGTGLSVFAASA